MPSTNTVFSLGSNITWRPMVSLSRMESSWSGFWVSITVNLSWMCAWLVSSRVRMRSSSRLSQLIRNGECVLITKVIPLSTANSLIMLASSVWPLAWRLVAGSSMTNMSPGYSLLTQRTSKKKSKNHLNPEDCLSRSRGTPDWCISRATMSSIRRNLRSRSCSCRGR